MSNEFYADVKIRKTEEGVTSVHVNGQEMNTQILDGSLVVTFPSSEIDYSTARVQMTLLANVDMDFPESEIVADFKSGDEA
jgi:hypothetical protein